MPNSEYLPEFTGLEVVEFPSREVLDTRVLRAENEAREEGRPEPDSAPVDERLAAGKADPGAFAWRLHLMPFGVEEHFREYLERFIGEVGTTAVTALIIGDCWNPALANDDVGGVRDALIEHAAAFPALRALFFGEVTYRDAEMSWLAQTDVSPLVAAFPGLTEFVVRGTDRMSFTGGRTFELAWNVARHESLRRLTFQAHRLEPAVVRGVLASELPELEHLELFPGDGAEPADLAPLLSGSVFPALRSLGLRNGANTDELVTALVGAPVTRRLTAVDLSLGTLTDRGARALLDAPVFGDLKRLDLHHHYMSEEMTERVRAHFTGSGVDVDVDDRQEPDEDDAAYFHEWEPDENYYYRAVIE
ncbi:STM4015 family protein [Actinomadura sp. WMMB 499]|uniref:STM4015 family protein n=1 Tax=Actinomadura sp. WMMB 499 TaxID=1219491 RepID=UPI00159E79EA|nr:STM4015 family protein [Actinomadura sp. WMMB 499]